MENTNVCFLDIETTGLNQDVLEPWNVGLIMPDGTEYEWFLPVFHLHTADPVSLQISKFMERHPSFCVSGEPITSPEMFCRDFMRLTWGKHLAGNVVSFDEEALRNYLKRLGYSYGWHYHLIDVESMAAGYLQARPPWKSTELMEQLGIDRTQFDEHTALGDARWARAVYYRIMDVSVGYRG